MNCGPLDSDLVRVTEPPARPSWAEQRLSKRRPQPDADEQTRNILNEALVKLRRADYKLRVLTDS
jgi:hypothetical protein